MSTFLDELEAHIPALRRYARALTRSAEDADDLVQDCLERAIRKKALWRPQRGALRPWLFKIMVNLFRNDLRARRIRPTSPLADVTLEPSAPAPQPYSLALGEVGRALAQLAAHEREALLLVVVEGQSYANAAQILDIPQGTLMSRLSRARANLRRLTGETESPRIRAVK